LGILDISFFHPYAQTYSWSIASTFNVVGNPPNLSILSSLSLENVVGGSGKGKVTVRGCDNNGCCGFFVSAFVSVFQLIYNKSGSFIWSSAYPNPASTELTIDKIENAHTSLELQNVEKSKTSPTKVLLFSHSTTKLVYSQDYPSSTQQIKIDTSKLPNGVYYLNIVENGEKVKEQTIIVNH
jgi:hypothetical protein